MRSLIYVPIIHAESDMGSLGPQLGRTNSSLVGGERWARHKDVVASFWNAIEDCLATLDGTTVKIYQDGLAADGDLGKRIVEESARRGSKNYDIVLHLVNKGAEIRKTEDISLLLEEYKLISNVTSGKSGPGKLRDYAGDRLRKEQLTKQRDQFIAKRINESLRPGETGILFLGAYHNVLPLLEKDIVVTPVKDQTKIRAYFDELLTGRDDDSFEKLARYVASAVQESIQVAGGP